MKKLLVLFLLLAAPAHAVTVPEWDGRISIMNGAGAILNITGPIGVGTVQFLPSTPTLGLTGVFIGLDPVVTWQNTGQTIPISALGTNSDLACGLDCVLTIGAASFHLNSIDSVGGDIQSSLILSGIGTMILPGEAEFIDRFSLMIRPDVNSHPPQRLLAFGFGHFPLPAPSLGAGIPGLLAIIGGFYWRRRTVGWTT